MIRYLLRTLRSILRIGENFWGDILPSHGILSDILSCKFGSAPVTPQQLLIARHVVCTSILQTIPAIDKYDLMIDEKLWHQEKET